MLKELSIHPRIELTAETLDAYFASLSKKGIRKLGDGHFSTVFTHPKYPNVAVKVIRRPDLEYLKYLKFCQKNQSNPWLPKVYGQPIVKYVDSPKETEVKRPRSFDEYFEISSSTEVFATSHQKVIFVFLERLVTASFRDIEKACLYFISLCPGELDHLLKRFRDEPNAWLELFTHNDWMCLSAQKVDKNVAVLAKFFSRVRTLDLHKGNVRLRGKQLVFVDPLASNYTS